MASIKIAKKETNLISENEKKHDKYHAIRACAKLFQNTHYSQYRYMAHSWE
ncbi:hypothetical protein LX92_01349 [Maribacter polysiphoniae]|uniref:Uncharacterized protein n=1 Tax=Maribacter polysiphoniae TaxID=429344 RepID=A0A316EPN2_9FLAO|nr:hypothetical protein LX92_01349 [Maribacter polysiphoniae]